MKKVKMIGIDLLFLCVVVSMFFSTLSFAAEMEESSTYKSATQSSLQTASSSNITADELKGMRVVNQFGEDIGKIKEVKTDPQNSSVINFVTLAKGGVIGIGESKYAVPFKAFIISQDKNQATLSVDESLLSSAPKQAADMSDNDFELQLEKHYGIAPAWESGEGTSSPEMEEQPSPEAEID